MTSASFGPTKGAAVNGTTLAYREQGSGEPVVFVHGGISDLRTWDQQLAAIGRAYRAIAYSRRFHRPNEDIEPGADDPWGDHAEDLAAFLREIGAAPAHLVGNSQGAYITLLTAIRHPELVRTLVIEEPPVLPLFVATPPRLVELLRLFATRPRTAFAMAMFGARTVAPIEKLFRQGENEKALATFTRGVLGDEFFDRLSEARKDQARENLSTLRAFVIGDVPLPPLPENEVRGVRVPSLLLTGQHSATFLHHLTDRLAELLPVVERAEIPDASHLMHEDNAPAVNEAIVEFLRKQGGPTPPLR